MNQTAEVIREDEPRSMQDLIIVSSVPAALNVNFEELEAHLKAELEKYDITVTAETVPGAKQLATELNKTAKVISDKRIEMVKAVSGPIKAFEERMKSLTNMCTEGREKILKQVEKFENETREQVKALLISRLNSQYEKQGIRPEFQNVVFDDLVKLTAITKGGSLAANTRSELDQRITTAKILQDRTDRRLLELENASYKAGLASPLTIDHVRSFLMAEDNVYQDELARIIKAETKRQEEAEAALRLKLEREAKEKSDREAREQAQQKLKAEAVPEPEPEKPAATVAAQESAPATKAAPSGDRISWRVTCTIEIDTPAHITAEAIENQLSHVLKTKAGITSLKTVKAIHKES